ncbi:3-isopropylmalate dehydratase small subunit [Flexistipes sp.]|uniref:3-isopropylmalate dehydratase small subunit n=1 Tax=Flexistipes sp. TaxID=3088135 RepID=UPI002E2261C3|nr:3-isopropylmalate dehydratase small subunit [Flexistipes sp.]
MSINPISKVEGRAVPIVLDDIDTDRIIPARYLKCVTFDGLGGYAFYDDRFNTDGTEKKHPLNDKRFKGANIIISGANFGCGSSREHAPQAIKRAGIDAVVAESFAEIFHGNATTLGIVCITLSRSEINELKSLVEKSPETKLLIDVEKETLHTPGKTYKFQINQNAKKDLLAGTYDSLAELLANMDKVRRFEKELQYFFSR